MMLKFLPMLAVPGEPFEKGYPVDSGSERRYSYR